MTPPGGPSASLRNSRAQGSRHGRHRAGGPEDPKSPSFDLGVVGRACEGSDGGLTALHRRMQSGGDGADAKGSGALMIDLRPHCDRSPYVVNELLPLRRVFRLFSTMGLRHLPVVDEHSCIVGMITRKDFLKIKASSFHTLSSARRQETRQRYEIFGKNEVHEPRESQQRRRSSGAGGGSRGADDVANGSDGEGGDREQSAGRLAAVGSALGQAVRCISPSAAFGKRRVSFPAVISSSMSSPSNSPASSPVKPPPIVLEDESPTRAAAQAD